jgi:hypothetical protein
MEPEEMEAARHTPEKKAKRRSRARRIGVSL